MASALVLLGVATTAGLAGGVHCAAMCGGIAGLGAAGSVARSRPLADALLFHGGRILTYSFLGPVLALGADRAARSAPPAFEGAGRLIVALMMAALALRILANRDLLGIERLGGRLFRRLRPLWTRLLSSSGWCRQVSLGAVWGLMPCGLLYSMLAVAAAPAEPLLAAASMAAFGLATVPALAAITLGVGRVRRSAAWQQRARLASGTIVLVGALWTGAAGFVHLSHRSGDHAGHHHSIPAAQASPAT